MLEGIATYGTTGRRLFTTGQITTATLIGAPIAGCILLYRNYRALGEVNEARKALMWGAVSTLLILWLSTLLPQRFPNSALPIGYCFAMMQLTKRLQGSTISAHVAAGGLKGSWCVTIGVGLACLTTIFVLVFCVVLVIFGE
jgi:hypothetical protein